MGTTTFSGPVQTGTLPSGVTGGPNYGYAVLSQVASIAQNGTSAVSSTFYLPAGSQILDFLIDVTTAFNSATSAVLSIGKTAAGTDYVSSVSVASAGRQAPTYSATQLTNMLGIGTNTAVVATVTPTGATTAGAVTVTVRYVQQPQ